jgi:hypothetical protein
MKQQVLSFKPPEGDREQTPSPRLASNRRTLRTKAITRGRQEGRVGAIFAKGKRRDLGITNVRCAQAEAALF